MLTDHELTTHNIHTTKYYAAIKLKLKLPYHFNSGG